MRLQTSIFLRGKMTCPRSLCTLVTMMLTPPLNTPFWRGQWSGPLRSKGRKPIWLGGGVGKGKFESQRAVDIASESSSCYTEHSLTLGLAPQSPQTLRV